MTYENSIKLFKAEPKQLNEYDKTYSGWDGAQYAKGFRIYALDKEGNRHTINTNTEVDKGIEENVFYWHTKEIAQGYMLYLAEAQPQRTYGLYSVDTEVGVNEWEHNFGQVAKRLCITDQDPIFTLTPELFQKARQNPDVDIFKASV